MKQLTQVMIMTGVGMLILASVTSGTPAAPTGRGSNLRVYFQVMSTKGMTSDLSSVPRISKGIRKVVRITRSEPAATRARILSTGSETVTIINKGKTTRVQLIWSGVAWVAPPATKQVSQPVVNSDAVKLAQRHKLADLADAKEKKQTSSKSSDENEIIQSGVLSFSSAGGRVVVSGPAGIPDSKSDAAVIVMPHNLQIWPVASGEGERTYTVSIPHAEAGNYGAFRYIAYSDSDGDGKPDKLVARSDLARASRAGQWSSWTFTTSATHLFVGNTWQRSDTTHCVHPRRHDLSGGDSAAGLLGDEVYISGYYGGVPVSDRKFYPYLQNIRVKLNMNDSQSARVRKSGVKMIGRTGGTAAPEQ